jgi:hypothetical protein
MQKVRVIAVRAIQAILVVVGIAVASGAQANW